MKPVILHLDHFAFLMTSMYDCRMENTDVPLTGWNIHHWHMYLLLSYVYRKTAQDYIDPRKVSMLSGIYLCLYYLYAYVFNLNRAVKHDYFNINI